MYYSPPAQLWVIIGTQKPLTYTYDPYIEIGVFRLTPHFQVFYGFSEGMWLSFHKSNTVSDTLYEIYAAPSLSYLGVYATVIVSAVLLAG